MKIKGFTISEVLIALGIVAVIAVMVGNIVNNVMPDSNKAIVLKAYKTLMNTNKDLLEDPGIYVLEKNGSCVGLDCTSQSITPPYNNSTFSGKKKYYSLLEKRLNTVSSDPTNNTFTTADKVIWTVSPKTSNNSVKPSYHLVTITIPGNKGSNCSFSSGCTKPNKYLFLVLNNGAVKGADPLTVAYLKNPLKLNDKKNDYILAKSMLQSANNPKDELSDLTLPDSLKDASDYNDFVKKFNEQHPGLTPPTEEEYQNMKDNPNSSNTSFGGLNSSESGADRMGALGDAGYDSGNDSGSGIRLDGTNRQYKGDNT